MGVMLNPQNSTVDRVSYDSMKLHVFRLCNFLKVTGVDAIVVETEVMNCEPFVEIVSRDVLVNVPVGDQSDALYRDSLLRRYNAPVVLYARIIEQFLKLRFSSFYFFCFFDLGSRLFVVRSAKKIVNGLFVAIRAGTFRGLCGLG